MAQEPLKQEREENQVLDKAQVDERQQFIVKTPQEQATELYDRAISIDRKANGILEDVEKTKKEMDWVRTITYLGFMVVILTALAVALAFIGLVIALLAFVFGVIRL